ncbi:MAG: phosphate acyltransferase [Bacteroidales bacterium]|nr:phosphate acyltransferase [Bacteroidales bacterium]
MKIGLDAMGGDYAPVEVIKGAILARELLPPEDDIVLFGPSGIIIPEISSHGGDPNKFEIVDAPEVIGMGERPIKAFTQKPMSSISVGFRYLKNKEVDSFASAGNSGATLVGAMYSVNSIPGVIRPSTAGFIPKEDGGVNIILDIGTVPDARPDVLYQFAILGSIYARYVHCIKNPRVGLLNIGAEEEKGNLLCQSAYRLLNESRDFQFAGNIEGGDIFLDKADVIVCDGFTGNIVLKQLEAIYQIMNHRKLVDEYFARFDYENYGGSPILGVNSTVMIGHGVSSSKAIKNMILLSKEIHDAKLSQKIKRALSRYITK